MHFIQATNLRKIYPSDDGQGVLAIKELTFSVAPSTVTAIVGKTGCGKSTLLKILLGLERPTSGELLVTGERPYQEFSFFKGKIGAIFQHDRLLPWRTALGNVELGLEVLGYGQSDRTEIARHWLNKMELGGFLDAHPSQLSGGMRQRVAIARAFAIEPDLLLADEAFGHLDQVTAKGIRDRFLEVTKHEGRTAVLVTHQLDEALLYADRVLVLGRPAELLRDIGLDDLSRDSRLALVHDVQGYMTDAD